MRNLYIDFDGVIMDTITNSYKMIKELGIDLNDSEKDMIKYYNQGEALFVCGNRRMRINIIVTQEELDSFGSGGGL